MFKIEAIVREEKYEDVKAALNDVDVHGITVSQVMGCGVQKGYTEVVRGTKIDVHMLPKIKFEIIVPSEKYIDGIVKAIRQAALTGKHGDGKIFVYSLTNAVRIRTGQTGPDAIYHEKD
jgi:nitrogen regulatory protein P-II 1